MNCTSCGHANRDTARFCEHCGGALARVCAACRAELRPTARFCDACGQAVGSVPPGAAGAPVAGAAAAIGAALEGGPEPRPASPVSGETRKIVTIIFADLAGSTSLHERLDPEAVRHFMESYYRAMRAAVGAHEGTVVKLLGDGVMAAFGVPRVAENDALRAVRAGMDMQRLFGELARREAAAVGDLGLRVGINTGEVVVGSDRTDVVGDPVNVAARLQQEARPGDVILGEATQRLVGGWVTLMPLGRIAIKGRVGGVKAFRVVSLDPPAGSATASFVGREEELERIGVVFDAAVREKVARAAVLLGSPGLGKSRLVEEFALRLGDTATVLRAHCDAGGGATFAPLVRGLREFFQVESGPGGPAVEAAIAEALPAGEAEVARVVRGIAGFLAGSGATPEETFFVLRRLLGLLAQDRPVVLVIDDVHWAEPLLLEFIEHVIQWGGGMKVFVLLAARPELRELRSAFVAPGGPVSDVIMLSGLDAGAAMKLAAGVIGASDLPAALAARVLATSEGNPLFVGELVRMLVDEGVIVREGNRWVAGAGLDAVEMPPTIHALLAARIERLRPEEIAVLERASVMGRQFSRGAVAELLPREVRDLDARLEALRRAELIERDSGWFLGEPVLRFHHVLIRDAAYRRLLKGTRAELHARLAAWIEARSGGAQEHEETLGWHLEQAHQHLRELGPLDGEGRDLGRRAARHLSAAGRRALDRDDVPLAANLLGRALDRLEPGDPARDDLMLDGCESLLAAGDVRRAAAMIGELGACAGDSRRLRAWHTCFAGQLKVMTDPVALQETADGVAAAAAELAGQADAAGEAKAHFVHAQALARLGRVGACEAALDLALAAARRAGDRRRANAVLAGAPLAALWGPSPVTRASGRCLDVVRVLRITQGAPAVEAVALSCQGLLEALRGRTDAARRMIASARKMVEELGITHRLLETDVFASRIDLIEGDAAAAERGLRAGFEGLRDLGHRIDAARAAALLGRALLAQDRAGEAEAVSRESEALAGDDLQASISWRGVRAEALSRRGDHDGAIGLARTAVALAASTDALLDHADARMALAAVLRAAGRAAEAAGEEARAVELWKAKGATEPLARSRTSESVPAAPARHRPTGAPGIAAPARNRRIRPNAALRTAERHRSAILNRDVDGIRATLSENLAAIYHPTETPHGAEGFIETWKIAFGARSLRFEQEAIATLGDSLVLVRQSVSHEGVEHGSFAGTGPIELVRHLELQVDGAGQAIWAEAFDGDRLSDAIGRLYERYAELMPEGPERERAANVARSYAAFVGRPDLRRMRESMYPSYVCVDHRPLGTWSTQGADELIEHFRLQEELAAGFSARDEDVLALEPEGCLVRRTAFGDGRESGGNFENRVLILIRFGPDGRMIRGEVWDPEQEAGALARFEELASEKKPEGAARRIRRNAALRQAERHHAAIVARDADAIHSHCHPDMKVFYHPTGSPYGTDGLVETWKSAFGAKSLRCEQTTLATLGESLVLVRQLISHDGLQRGDLAEVGPIEVDTFLETQVDDHDKCVWAEVFAGDRLSDAITRLYQRYAELMPEGPERERAARVARSFEGLTGRVDLRRMRDALASSYVGVDHRPLGTWATQSAEGAIEHFRAQEELAAGFSAKDEDVLALEPDGHLLQRTYYGEARESGGYFENRILVLFLFGPDGRAVRSETWDAEQRAEALARFEELCTPKAEVPASPLSAFENAASRADAELMRCFNARDWEGVLACVAPEVVFDERRRLVRNTADRTVWLEQFRMMYDLPDSRFRIRLLATRGERLSLHRHEFTAKVAEGGGPLEMDPHLTLHEVDAQGRIVAIMLFELDAAKAAYAELDARYGAGEGSRHPAIWKLNCAFVDAVASRDWAPVIAMCAPEIIEYDHRRIAVLGTTLGPEAWTRNFQTLVDLAGDTVYRTDHFRGVPRGGLSLGVWRGSRDGGDYELPLIPVIELNEDGRIIRADIYDVEQYEQARKRFEGIAVAGRPAPENVAPQSPFANAATRADERFLACWEKRDWAGILALHVPPAEFLYDDRRRLMTMQLRGEPAVEQLRFLFDQPGGRMRFRVLATRDDRLSLMHVAYESYADQGGGPLSIEYLGLDDLDGQGRIQTVVLFDCEAADEAYNELDARWQARDALDHPRASAFITGFRRAFAARDWTAMTRLYAPDQIAVNHRLVGWGTLSGPGGWTSALEELVALAPDVRLRVDHLRTCDRGFIMQYAWVGTRDGGCFESPMVMMVELDAGGRQCRLDLWDVERLDEAWTHFERLRTPVAPMPNPFANAASRVVERITSCSENQDWPGIEALLSPDIILRDQRRLSRSTVSGRDLFLVDHRMLSGLAGRWQSSLIATRGERLALFRLKAEVEQDGPDPGELEHLNVIEVNERREVTAQVSFGAADLDAAFEELNARYENGLHGVARQTALWMRRHGTLARAGDWQNLTGLYAPDFEGHDHRLAGWGTLRGPAEMLKALQAMADLAPDARLYSSHVRISDVAVLMESSWWGTRDGGAFESPFLAVLDLGPDGKARRIDFFDQNYIDRALARFAELQAPNALRFRIPPLAGVRHPRVVDAMKRWLTALEAGLTSDRWEAVRDLTSPGVRFEDRQRLSLVSGDRDLMIESLRARGTAGARVDATLIGLGGDRVAVFRMLWSGGPPGGRFEVEYLGLIEIDEAGLMTASILFDADSMRDAQREMWDRWAAIDPAARELTHALGNLIDAFNDRDPVRLRAAVADDLRVEDHRRTGMGPVDGAEAYIAVLTAIWDRAADTHGEAGWLWPAHAPGRALTVFRLTGTLAAGGPFESEFLYLYAVEHGRIARLELFEVDALEAALARFEELRPDPLRIPPNAAHRAIAKIGRPKTKEEIDRLRGLVSADFVYDDRQKQSLIRGGVEEWVRAVEYLMDEMDAWLEARPIATAGERLALDHVVWRESRGGAPFEIPGYRVVETDEEGLLRALVIFGPDDLDAAHDELFERYVAQGADGAPPAVIDAQRALNLHDLERIRAGLCDDYVLRDHRRTGVGELDGPEASLASLRTVFGLTEQATARTLYIPAASPQGHVLLVQVTGIGLAGGAYESLYIAVATYRDGKVASYDIFEPEQLDLALAYYRERCAASQVSG